MNKASPTALVAGKSGFYAAGNNAAYETNFVCKHKGGSYLPYKKNKVRGRWPSACFFMDYFRIMRKFFISKVLVNQEKVDIYIERFICVFLHF